MDFIQGMSAHAVRVCVCVCVHVWARGVALSTDRTRSTAGIVTYAGTGDATLKSGTAVHYYVCNTSMVDKAFYNADGDFLIGAQRRRPAAAAAADLR